MTGNNQSLFFSPEEKGRAFSDVLKEVQEYISSKYSTLMVEGGNEEVKQQVKRYIAKYVADYRISAAAIPLVMVDEIPAINRANANTIAALLPNKGSSSDLACCNSST